MIHGVELKEVQGGGLRAQVQARLTLALSSFVWMCSA